MASFLKKIVQVRGRPVGVVLEHDRYTTAIAMERGYFPVSHTGYRSLTGKQTGDPRAVRARLHHEGGARMLLREDAQALARVDDFRLGDDVAGGREDAHRVTAVPEIDTDGFVVRAHKAENNHLTLPREALYAFSFLLDRHFLHIFSRLSKGTNSSVPSPKSTRN